MSMIACFVPASADRIAALRGQPENVWLSALDTLDVFDTDKAWHGIHFLLVGSGGPTGDLLSKVIFGGDEVGPDIGYGPIRLLAAADVKQVASALDGLPFDKLRARYNPALMMAQQIYPQAWDDQEQPWIEDLEHHYPKLVDFYRAASARGDGVLLWIG